ncbi:MAG: transcription elongation factor GreB [Myxococcota bacterium]|nr:transcription elongation factor GreB [Myxococcota bacterium]
MASRYSNYITPEGAQKLEDELKRLWNVERPRVTQGVADAAAEGDRSENAEYIYGKKRLRQIHSRCRYLKKRLEALTVVAEKPAVQGRVFFACWVRVEDEEGEEHIYRLVGPDETDSERGFISIDSPMGRALIGKSLDDEVIVKRPKGDALMTIVEVATEPLEP